MKGLVFKTSQGDFAARITQNKNPDIVKEIVNHLPIHSKVNTWGEEIYFETPVVAEVKDPQEVVPLGAVGYWPPGKALCLFFGRTPISTETEIRPASAVGVFAKLFPPFDALKLVQAGEDIEVQPLE